MALEVPDSTHLGLLLGVHPIEARRSSVDFLLLMKKLMLFWQRYLGGSDCHRHPLHHACHVLVKALADQLRNREPDAS